MSGIDKPTGRVVALIVLLILVAAALRGYLPAADGGSHSEPGSGRAALTFVIVVLSASVALMAFAIIARLRDPRADAPSAGKLSEMLGGGKGRPSWRVLLIGLGVIVAWLLVATLLARLVVPQEVASSLPSPDQSAPPPAPRTAPPRQDAPDNPGHTLEILLAYTVPLLVMIVAAAAIMARRRRRAAPPASVAADDAEFAEPAQGSQLLARAAELGLAEMTDLDRGPREAIIACYAAMERELANVPGAVPQDFDTPTEVLARAVARGVLRADNAGQLVNLFAEARFSPHVMNEGHRELAVRVLRLVLDELAPRTQRAAL
ncbi:DUF4129 domain-containing protein [Mycobacterium gastri]|uniref:Protein-glutamine gamma-glutamyltransferase-like C-terminal domain-containing protein n=1 Tax=Mycobacterium gastri TaxID=1777 RepID=A0A1X1V0H2_MYCGS|nr:DUF4129 domain-containing protein [Mycobacterium gastri]ETW21418.1 hypothetical protein MGAST_25965 [Mycobacterium gastri 'Wayne']ORV62527.1 hypothetical protein AWC07_01570 [Mycobacterium gastri]